MISFCSIKRFCEQAVKTLIRLRGCILVKCFKEASLFYVTRLITWRIKWVKLYEQSSDVCL